MTEEQIKRIRNYREEIEKRFREHPERQHFICNVPLAGGVSIVCVDKSEYGRIRMMDSQAIHHDLDCYGPDVLCEVCCSLREKNPEIFV